MEKFRKGSFVRKTGIGNEVGVRKTGELVAGTLRLVGTNEDVVYNRFKKLLINQDIY